MPSFFLFIAAFLVFANLLSLGFLLFITSACRLFGVGIREIRLGGIANLKEWSRGPVKLVLGVPLGMASLQFAGESPESPDATDEDVFVRRSRWARALIAISGSLAFVLAAVALIGFERGSREIASGFWQVPIGGLRSAVQIFSDGQPPLAEGWITKWGGLLQQGAWITAFGVLAAKIAAFNLLPVPAMNGFAFIREWLRAPEDDSLLDRPMKVLLVPGLLLLLAMAIGWVAAVVRVYRGG